MTIDNTKPRIVVMSIDAIIERLRNFQLIFIFGYARFRDGINIFLLKQMIYFNKKKIRAGHAYSTRHQSR
jgi:hypothetical protein